MSVPQRNGICCNQIIGEKTLGVWSPNPTKNGIWRPNLYDKILQPNLGLLSANL